MNNFNKFIESKRKYLISTINWIEFPFISVRYDNEENRVINFDQVINEFLYLNSNDAEYKLMNENEFNKVKVESGSLKWENITINVLGHEIPLEIDGYILRKYSILEK